MAKLDKRKFTIAYNSGEITSDMIHIAKELYLCEELSDDDFMFLYKYSKEDKSAFKIYEKTGIELFKSERFEEFKKYRKEQPTVVNSNRYYELLYGKDWKSKKPKQPNLYNVVEVMERYNISEAEAIKRVDELKKKTSTTKETFIRKYGKEEGIRLYNEKCKKDAFRNTLEGKIDLFGEEEGRERYYKQNKANSISSSLEGKIEKFGEEEGRLIQEEMNRKRSYGCSKEGLYKKFGENADKIIESKRVSKERLILKYGKDKANDIIKRRSIYFADPIAYLKEKFGFSDLDATIEWHRRHSSIKYNNREEIIQRLKQIEIENELQHTRYNASNESLRLFLPIIEYIKETYNIDEDEIKIGYGNSKEKIMYYTERNFYKYDFCIEKLKLIIEYDGAFWHVFDERTNPISKNTKDYELEYQRKKDNVAVSNGYEIFRIRSDQENKFETAKGIIDNAYNKYKEKQ